MDSETKFLTGLIGLQYGENVINELKELSNSLDWAKGWPLNDMAFWNAEAFMWENKIEKAVRNLISSELKELSGRNLDLGCGAYSYVPSVGFDFSEKMLKFNENCYEKVIGDINSKLPFNCEFDSVTTIFVLNYVDLRVVEEVNRVLVDSGKFVVVLSSIGVNGWQRQKEINNLNVNEWLDILGEKFKVKFFEKEKLWFFICEKKVF